MIISYNYLQEFDNELNGSLLRRRSTVDGALLSWLDYLRNLVFKRNKCEGIKNTKM